MLILLCMAPTASAAGGYSVGIDTVDYVSDIVYHADGTMSYGEGQGFYTISNPASSSPLFSVNMTPYPGSIILIGNIPPLSDHTGTYEIDQANVKIPLLVKETITPATLTQGKPQQVNITVEVRNVATHTVTGFKYTKQVPSGLSLAQDSFDTGTLAVANNITWTVDSIPAGATLRMSVSFSVMPTSNVYFPAAYIWYTAGDSFANGAFDFSGSTVTSFTIQKTHPSANVWQAQMTVPDASEFSMNVTHVSLYRSNANDPFVMVTVEEYSPYALLGPGESWTAMYTEPFDATPAYFVKVAYRIPYTLDRTAQPLTPARTEPFTITVQGTQTGGSVPGLYQPNSTSTPIPTPTAQPYVPPAIVYVDPKPDMTIRDNTTTMNVSILDPQGPGFVAFYYSGDNDTWTFIGKVTTAGNTASYAWNVPETNGRYYLKAEYYNIDGFVGSAYTRMQVQHESRPIEATTIFSQTADWLVLLTILAVLLIVTLFILPPLFYKPIVYDASALRLLSSASYEDLSKLPRAVRPNNVEFTPFSSSDRIRPREVKKLEEQKRWESSYGLDRYDAAALELAKEKGLTIYSDDARMMAIYESVGVRADHVEKLLKNAKK